MNKVISREYVEKNYTHKDKIRQIKEKILFTLKKGENVPIWKIMIIDKFLQELLEETKDVLEEKENGNSNENNNTYAMQK